MNLKKKILLNLSISNGLLTTSSNVKFKQAYFIDAISNIEDKNLLHKTSREVLPSQDNLVSNLTFINPIIQPNVFLVQRSKSLPNFYTSYKAIVK